MIKRFIIGLDEGTTSCRCVVFDKIKNNIVFINKKRFTQYFPKPGWVEHDANEIWNTMHTLLDEAITNLKLTDKNTFGIGITNQRESVVAWDKRTGKAVAKSIVWQCRRTAKFCDKISKINRKIIQNKTGLIVDAYFSASKIKWLLDNDENCKKLLNEQNLCVGTLDSFLVYNLTKCQSFVTDTTNASRTMLFNINTLTYDKWLLNFFKIPEEILPKVVNCNDIVGTYSIDNSNFPICGIIGDQQSSLFGQACFEKGYAKCTYGTGCFILSNSGQQRINGNKMLSTIAWTISGKTNYALEGSVFNAGSSIDWLVDNVKLGKDASEISKLAESVSNTDGVYCVPAFTGMGAPYWNQYCTGMITGLTRGSNNAHIARATFESMAYNVKDIFEYMKKRKVNIQQLRVDGGVTNSSFLMQFQSDILNINVSLPTQNEATVLGAIYMCGFGCGAYKSLEEINSIIQFKKEFSPSMDNQTRENIYKGWKKAVKQCLST